MEKETRQYRVTFETKQNTDLHGEVKTVSVRATGGTIGAARLVEDLYEPAAIFSIEYELSVPSQRLQDCDGDAENGPKLRELNIAEYIQVRNGVEHARMTGVLKVPKHLVEHALAYLPVGWADSEFHKIEEF